MSKARIITVPAIHDTRSAEQKAAEIGAAYGERRD